MKPGFYPIWAAAGLLRLGCLLGVFQLLAGFLGLLLHAVLQAALAFGKLGFGNWFAVISTSEAFKRNLDRVRSAAEVDRGEDHVAALLEAGDHRVGQRNFGGALVWQADSVVELL